MMLLASRNDPTPLPWKLGVLNTRYETVVAYSCSSSFWWWSTDRLFNTTISKRDPVRKHAVERRRNALDLFLSGYVLLYSLHIVFEG